MPRTGSTSFVGGFDKSWQEYGGVHESARDLFFMPLYMPDRYHSFSIIRNPWAWMVSLYHMGWYGGCNGIKEVWPGNRIEPHDTPGIEYGQRSNFTFSEWLYLRKTTQIDWLCDETEILVDEIRRFEDIELDSWEQKSDHLDFHEYYTPETAEYVGKKCWREVELGGYSF